MRIIKRENHNKEIKEEKGKNLQTFTDYFNLAVKHAEFMESLGMENVSVIPEGEGWCGYQVIVQYKNRELRITKDYHKKFHCNIFNEKRINGHYETEARNTLEPLKNYSFDKLTAKKLIEKLEREVEVQDLAIKLAEKAKKAGLQKFKEIKAKIDFIARAVGVEATEMETEYRLFGSVFGKVNVYIDSNHKVRTSGNIDSIIDTIKKIRG